MEACPAERKLHTYEHRYIRIRLSCTQAGHGTARETRD